MSERKSRENHLRRLAERQGLALRKSRRRNSEAPDYGMFQLVEPGSNRVVAGDEPHAYSLSLEDVERWLTNDEATPQAHVVPSPYRTRRASKYADPETHEREPPA
jgi:hypothetical protein